MNKNLAVVISFIFHPVFLTLYGLIILFHSGLYISYLQPISKQWIYLIVITNTIIIPLCFVPIYLHKGIIHSLQMETKRERIVPFTVSLVLLYIAYFLFKKLQVPFILRGYLLTAVIANLIALFFTLKMKISLHLTSLGALTGILLVLIFYFTIPPGYLLLLFLISGVTASARLSLSAHNSFQVYLGYILGILSAGILFYFLLT